MTSSISCLAVLSLLALSTHLPNASAAATAPRGPAMAAKFLSAVNDVRRQAGVPPLAWNATVAQRAKQRADWLRSSGGCDLSQAGREPPPASEGGNLTYYLFGGPGRVSPAKVVGDMAGERKWYDAGRKACAVGKQCGDYLNIVSPVSTQLGCGVAACASGKTVVVCEYYPF